MFAAGTIRQDLCKGSSPVCVFLWDLSTPAETKPRPQRSQLYGFSPVWDRMCCFRWLNCLKALVHQLHLKRKQKRKQPG